MVLYLMVCAYSMLVITHLAFVPIICGLELGATIGWIASVKDATGGATNKTVLPVVVHI